MQLLSAAKEQNHLVLLFFLWPVPPPPCSAPPLRPPHESPTLSIKYQSHSDSLSDIYMQEPAGSHQQAGLKVLVRVEGQGSEGQPLGPWPLDVEQRTMEEVCSLRSDIMAPDIMAPDIMAPDIMAPDSLQ